jgi:hypothetical protein
MILHSELKRQRKLVKNLKKKSLWSRTLEEVNFQPYSFSCFVVYTLYCNFVSVSLCRYLHAS